MIRKSLESTAWQIGGKGLAIVISLVTTGMLTRVLGGDGYGQFVLTTSIFVLLDSLADFGTKIIGVRELSQTDDRRMFWQIVWLRLTMAGAAFWVGMVLVWGWSGFAGIRNEAMVAMLMVGLTSVAGSWEILWQKGMEMRKKVLVESTFPLLFLGWIMLWGGGVSLMAVFGGYLIARFVSLVIGFGMTDKRYTGAWEKPNKGIILKLLSESWPMGVYMLVFAAYDRAVDSMMISSILGIQEVAWYGLAYKVYSNLVQPAYFMVVSVFPILSRKKVEVKMVFWQTMVLLVLGGLTVVMVVLTMAPWMVAILGGDGFEPAVAVLRWLMVALMFAYIQHLIGFTLISRGGQRQLLGIGLVVLVFNLGMNYMIIPRYGIVGAAIVTGATEALATLLMGWKLIIGK